MIHIETDPDEAIYRLAEGVEDDDSRIEGDIVPYGEPGFLEKNGDYFFTLIAEDGTGDGKIYKQSDGTAVEVEEWDLKEEFEDQESDGDDEEDAEVAV